MLLELITMMNMENDNSLRTKAKKKKELNEWKIWERERVNVEWSLVSNQTFV